MTAGEAWTAVCDASGRTSKPTFASGTTAPSGSVKADEPVVAWTANRTCCSFARRPRLSKLCEAFSSTSTSWRVRYVSSPVSVRSGSLTSQRYGGVVVPFAGTGNGTSGTYDAVHTGTSIPKPHSARSLFDVWLRQIDGGGGGINASSRGGGLKVKSNAGATAGSPCAAHREIKYMTA
eukprot:2075579-Pleurochrysis_carterae.AAC.2